MGKPLDPAVAQQMLHRALGMINGGALAAVVVGNWLMAHIITSWTMPSEVQSSAQTLITIYATLWIFRKYGLVALKAADGVSLDGTIPKQPNGLSPMSVPAVTPTPDPTTTPEGKKP